MKFFPESKTVLFEKDLWRALIEAFAEVYGPLDIAPIFCRFQRRLVHIKLAHERCHPTFLQFNTPAFPRTIMKFHYKNKSKKLISRLMQMTPSAVWTTQRPSILQIATLKRRFALVHISVLKIITSSDIIKSSISLKSWKTCGKLKKNILWKTCGFFKPSS